MGKINKYWFILSTIKKDQEYVIKKLIDLKKI